MNSAEENKKEVVASVSISDKQLARALSLQKRLAAGEQVTREDFTSEDWT